ncbi:ABC transporter substrate-binding protein [Actinokineospora globicatena]|uniref:ABC transporter substrate-binding protein n=1 Tax=Actinokineospora globicatena TaxID=103729 RepID=UPI0020A3C8B7|nr:ABC transporter substrate-binding protein [Actinokineospora globicatena]MCP2304540.1 putative hydroxymethylpyrimidine transport system substrate-binding protein [Actinokineospora globicatena]
MSMGATRRVLAAVLAVGLLAAGCGAGESVEPGGKAQVRVLMDWFPNPDHVGLYTAQDKGLFTAANLEVTLTPPSNPADPLKLVAARQVELGISYEPDVLMAAEQDLPVVAVAALVPVALNSLMAVGSSPVKSPEDLAGKTVGTAGLPSDDVYLKQITAKHGVDLNTVKKVNVSSNLVAAMLSGQVDATIGAYRNIEGVQLAQDGKAPYIVPVTDAGVPEYDELVLVANRDRLRDDAGYRDAVTRFVAALGKGVAAAQGEPSFATASIRKVATGYDGEALEKMVAATLPLLTNPRGFGRMDPAKWQAFAYWLYAEGMVKRHIDAASLMTNDHVPAG